MSDGYAIAAVSAVLQTILNSAVKSVLPDPPKVSAVPPDRIPTDQLAKTQLNLYLYHTTLNASWRNVGLPSADSNGHRLTNPPLAVDLHYLVTAYGTQELDAETLLGFAMHAFHEQQILSPATIRQALRDSAATPEMLPLLAASGLADQVERIKLTAQPMTTEDLSRLWSALQTPLRPSAAYLASVVLIQRDKPVTWAPPVRSIGTYVVPFRHPSIDAVENEKGPREPILATSKLVVLGQQLRAEDTRVRIGSVEVTPEAMAEDRLRVPLASVPADKLRAGIQVVQVVRPLLLGKPPVRHAGTESNVAALVLRPTITVTIPDPPIETGGLFQGKLQVVFQPRVGKSQRVQLMLDPWDPKEPAATTALAAPADNGVAAGDDDTTEILFEFKGLRAGTYTVRARVDGAESLLETDLNVTSPTFGLHTGEPQVTVP